MDYVPPLTRANMVLVLAVVFFAGFVSQILVIVIGLVPVQGATKIDVLFSVAIVTLLWVMMDKVLPKYSTIKATMGSFLVDLTFAVHLVVIVALLGGILAHWVVDLVVN